MLGKKLIVKDAPKNLVTHCCKKFWIPNPVYIKKQRLKLKTFGTPKILYLFKLSENKDLTFDTGQLNDVLNSLEELNVLYKVLNSLNSGFRVTYKWNEKFKLRDYQEDCVSKGLEKSGCIVVPAGGGKTIIGMNIIKKMGVKTLWLTHTKDLMYQSAERAEQCLNTTSGFIGDGKKQLGRNLTIATVQTLVRNPDLLKEFNDVGLVIVDESHHVPSSMFDKVLNGLKPFRKIGLTATPDRKDGLQAIMYASIGPKLIEIDRSILYNTKKLVIPQLEVRYTPFKKSTAFEDTKSVDIGGDGSDWHKLVELLTSCEDRLEYIVNDIINTYKGKKSLALVEWVAYGEKIKATLEKVLNRTARIEFIHGKVNKKERASILKDFAENKIDLLLATKLAREGLDLPNLNQLYLITPKRGDTGKNKDGAAIEQEIGRVMRYDPANPGKVATVYDYVDYDNGILKSQWYSRSKVYKRLGIKVSKKAKVNTDEYLDKMFPGLF